MRFGYYNLIKYHFEAPSTKTTVFTRGKDFLQIFFYWVH